MACSTFVILTVFFATTRAESLPPDEVPLFQTGVVAKQKEALKAAAAPRKNSPVAEAPSCLAPTSDSLSELSCQGLKSEGVFSVGSFADEDEEPVFEVVMPKEPEAAAAPPVPEAAAAPASAEDAAAPKPAASSSQLSSYIASCFDFLILVVILDGIRRCIQKSRETAAVAAPADVWPQLTEAALAGDVAKWQDLVDANGCNEINRTDAWGCALLHAAAKGGCQEIVEDLLDRGARVSEADALDETPLHFAARAGHAKVCEALLDHGADTSARNVQDWTPLVLAASEYHQEVCKLLISRGGGVAGLPTSEFPSLLKELLSVQDVSVDDLVDEFIPLDEMLGGSVAQFEAEWEADTW